MSRRLFKSMMTGAVALAMLGSGAAYAANGKAVAIVNGKPISQETFDLYVKMRNSQHPDQHASREQIINELVNSELIYQQALKEKLDKKPQIKEEIKLQRKNLLINAALRHHLEQHPISDKELKKEYDERIAHANVEQYKARHILTKTEDKAKEVIQKLKGGAKFADLAKKYSTDEGSAKNGGELGWFTSGQMVPPFSDAVAQLKKGEYTKEPIKTQFGWHVIELEDKRKMQPPAFDDVKGQIANVMRNKQLKDYVQSLREKAKIDIKQP
ncbi:MAG TPA: peptidylprolyl isomerase [Gammaproteobacteria bacterium]|nr:peptidylprolyl isomerase [Gammaproteobacteria bacterium]